jgi:outer membrane protein assembly factor BamB
MSPPAAPNQRSDAPARQAGHHARPGALSRSWWPVLIGGVLIVSAPIARRMLAVWDHQIGNLLAFSLAAGGLLVIIASFLLGRMTRTWKLSLVGLPLAAALLAMTLFQFEGFTGELVPRFVPRGWWWPAPQVDWVAADPDRPLAVTDDPRLLASRFSQFLGNDRNGRVDAAELESRWDQRPPEVLWRAACGGGWAGVAIASGIVVTLEQQADQEAVVARDLASGQTLWQHRYRARHFHTLGAEGPRSTPTIANGRVWTQGATGQVCCLELATGKLLWQINLLERAGVSQSESEKSVMWGRSGSPLLVDNRLFLPFGGRGPQGQPLIALEADTGETLWMAGRGEIAYASPLLAELDGHLQIVCVNEDHAAGYHVEDGTTLWEHPWPGSSSGGANVSQPVVIDGQHLLLSKGYGGGARLLRITSTPLPDPPDAQPLGDEGSSLSSFETGRSPPAPSSWQATSQWADNRILKTKFTSAVALGPHLYGLSDGILECVEALSGQRQWKQGRYGHGQLLLIGDQLLVLSESGQLHLVAADPTEFRPLAELNVLTGITWNIPAFSDDLVVVRNSQQIVCLRLPLTAGGLVAR